MPSKNKRYTREFSYTRPIMYQGEYYPSADSVISDEYGNKIKGTIFADAYGQYYTKDKSNNIFTVMPVENLDDVTITAQNKREPLMFNHYLTMNNDRTQVRNLPHREYNTSLKANAERGAREHHLWEQEHPNLSAWGEAAGAIPFGIATIPLAASAGQGLLGTAAGQAVKSAVTRVLANPLVEAANDAIGLGFAAKGGYDVSQGKFTPETAMDFLGLYPLVNSVKNVTKGIVRANELENSTWRGLENISSTDVLGNNAPLIQELNRVQNSANRAEESINTLRRQLETQNNAPARLLDDYNSSIESMPRSSELNLIHDNNGSVINRGGWQPSMDYSPEALRAIGERAAANDPAMREFNATINEMRNGATSRSIQPDIRFDDEGNPFLEGTIDNAPVGNNPLNATPTHVESVNLSSNTPSQVNGVTRIKARDIKAGETPYTTEEVDSWIDPVTGRLKRGIEFNADDEVYTGGHGIMFHPEWNEEQRDYTWILKQHLDAAKNMRHEMSSILRDNPTGRSGILVKTHSGDTSMDSTPLAYKMATRLGKNFKQMRPLFHRDTVISNHFGYNKAFKQGYSKELERARQLLESNPNYKATLLRDNNGNMTAFELTDNNGTFQIPLNSRQEVLDVMNDDLHKFNQHFGTSYSDITPYSSRKTGETWEGPRTYFKDVTPETMYPWDFGEEFELPNIYGIAYKKGGKIKRRLLTQL